MPPAKPCLGYPSRTAAVVALTRRGVPDTDIAARIGISVKDVCALLASAKRQERARHASQEAVVRMPFEIIDALAPFAQKRRTTAQAICRQIVGAALESDLIDAILDDGIADA